MRTKQQLLERLSHYKGIQYIYHDYGYIAWQLSTGENVEIMFIEVHEKLKGYATKLFKEMVTKIKPFNSIFVFRRATNEEAGHFYRGMGFTETLIKNLYKEDAVLGVVNYDTLCQNLSMK